MLVGTYQAKFPAITTWSNGWARTVGFRCLAGRTGTDVGTYYKLTANTTGTVQVDVANGAQTTTSRVVMIKSVDPQGIGGTGAGSGLRQCVVVFVKKFTDVAGQ